MKAPITWLRNGAYLVSEDGNWMMMKRYKGRKLEYTLMRSEGGGVWRAVRQGATAEELKAEAEAMEETA